MLKRVLVALTLLTIGFLGGHLLKRYPSSIVSAPQKTESHQELPKCFAGICPAYFSMDVDGDGLAESVVFIPMAMTKGAGKIWVIKDNNQVIFDSGEQMEIGVYQTKQQIEAGNGFILQYAVDIDSPKPVETKYIYKDGRFITEQN